ncbi:MAG TPA: GNAT family N-acetyltransferase [Candidatus Binataceae bacterium]
MSDDITVREADLADREQAAVLVEMLDAYMRDPMEGGSAPSEQVKRELIPGLRAHPACYVFFALRGEEPVGFAICFLGFSTFNARPLINIHDIFVQASARGAGMGKLLLDRIEAKARSMNGCAITLEVREDNHRARRLYSKFGFERAEVGAQRVPMEFWRKRLA